MSLPDNLRGYDKVSGYDETDDSHGIRKSSTISLITAPIEKRVVTGLVDKASYDEKTIVLKCEGLSIFTPDGLRTLLGGIKLSERPISPVDKGQNIRGVNFEIFAGDSVLISGPSGCGKSSLLRAISGLWELGGGKVIWNVDISDASISGGDSHEMKYEVPDGVFFLPQRPYNLLGSLRQQIAYPGDDEEVAEEGYVKTFAENRYRLGVTNRMNKDRSQRDVSGRFSINLDVDAKLLDILRKVRLEDLASRMGSGDERLGVWNTPSL